MKCPVNYSPPRHSSTGVIPGDFAVGSKWVAVSQQTEGINVKNCGTCKHFYMYDDAPALDEVLDDEETHGTCTRYPPSMERPPSALGDDISRYTQPHVRSSNRCGEHAEIEPETKVQPLDTSLSAWLHLV